MSFFRRAGPPHTLVRARDCLQLLGEEGADEHGREEGQRAAVSVDEEVVGGLHVGAVGKRLRATL